MNITKKKFTYSKTIFFKKIFNFPPTFTKKINESEYIFLSILKMLFLVNFSLMMQ